MLRPPLPLLALMGIGFGIWSLGFVLIYATSYFGCAAGWDAIQAGPVSLQRAILLVLGFVTMGAAALSALWLARAKNHQGKSSTPARFVVSVSQWATFAAVAATPATFAGIMMLSVC